MTNKDTFDEFMQTYWPAWRETSQKYFGKYVDPREGEHLEIDDPGSAWGKFPLLDTLPFGDFLAKFDELIVLRSNPNELSVEEHLSIATRLFPREPKEKIGYIVEGVREFSERGDLNCQLATKLLIDVLSVGANQLIPVITPTGTEAFEVVTRSQNSPLEFKVDFQNESSGKHPGVVSRSRVTAYGKPTGFRLDKFDDERLPNVVYLVSPGADPKETRAMVDYIKPLGHIAIFGNGGVRIRPKIVSGAFYDPEWYEEKE